MLFSFLLCCTLYHIGLFSHVDMFCFFLFLFCGLCETQFCSHDYDISPFDSMSTLGQWLQLYCCLLYNTTISKLSLKGSIIALAIVSIFALSVLLVLLLVPHLVSCTRTYCTNTVLYCTAAMQWQYFLELRSVNKKYRFPCFLACCIDHHHMDTQRDSATCMEGRHINQSEVILMLFTLTGKENFNKKPQPTSKIHVVTLLPSKSGV